MCLTLDDDNNVSDSNVAFLEQTAISKQAIIGHPIFELLDDPEGLLFTTLETLKKSLEPQKTVFCRLRPSLHGARETVVSVRAVRVGGESPVTLLSMQDMTRDLELAEEQRITRRQLYRSAQMASIGTLAAGVAHELNNPLTAILGFSDALLRRMGSHEAIELEELSEYLGIIHSETLRCRDIIDTLHKFARDTEPSINELSMFDCLRSALALIGPRAAKKHVRLVNKMPDDIIIMTDAHKMSQVLLNVLSNAIDFTPADGIVTIHEGTSPAPNMIRVAIEDTGCGISAHDLSRVFDPFFTTKEVGQGVGLGLSVCLRIMEECGGSIDIHSEGKGTTAILDIPRGNILNLPL
jgi:signal transduction histidine kinase